MYMQMLIFLEVVMTKVKNYFSKGEIALWVSSVLMIISAFCVFDRTNYMTLCASLIGVTSLIFNAKGNPFGQLLMVVFSLLYGIISYTFSYYGEMITYLGMTMPMAVYALISWLRNPYNGNKAEVKVNDISKRENIYMWIGTFVITFIFYFILGYFNTSNIIPSTLSVTTSFLAVYLTFRRSPYFALSYATNDIVLIVLWVLASMSDIKYISVVVCFIAFFVNDIYGFISWRKMKMRQQEITNQEGQNSVIRGQFCDGVKSSSDSIMKTDYTKAERAAQYANILFMILYGLGTGVTMLCAQYFGKGDMRTIHRVEGIALRFSLILSSVFAVAAMFFPQYMMRIFTPDSELIAIGTQYLRNISIAYLCWGIIEIYLATLRSVGKVAVATALNTFAFTLNIFLNAVFIFGFFGVPEMGAGGVALATSISRILELALCFIYSRKNEEVKLKLSAMFESNGILLKDFVRMAMPAVLNDAS